MIDMIDARISVAEQRGRTRLALDPRAKSARYDKKSGRMVIDLVNGCSYAFPVSLVQELTKAAVADLAEVVVEGVGFNLHWPTLDVDLYVPALVSGIFGTRAWMSRELASTAGRVRSPAKSAAARANGAKGGRPRKIAQT